MTVELVPLCTLDATLAEPLVVGQGPAGLRLVYEVREATIEGERLSGTLLGHATADWVTLAGTIGSLDVRATFQTDDGAIVYAHYLGRTDIEVGTIYVAPQFETGDPRYAWLNAIQAVGKGALEGSRLRYEWFEVR